MMDETLSGDHAAGRNLDFVIFGVPRSGTTALTHYISAVDGIHCSSELFGIRRDHARLVAPKCFFDKASKGMTASVQRTLDAIDGGGVRIYGNKTPRYFFNLKPLMAGIGTPAGSGRALLSYRNLRDVARSYASRAARPNDDWPQERTGVYAALDMIVLLKALVEVDGTRILVVPHDALLADWQSVTSKCATFLTHDPHPVIDADAAGSAEVLHQRDRSRPYAEPSRADQRALARLDIDAIEECFGREEPFLLAEVQDTLRQLAARLPKNPQAFAERMLLPEGGEPTGYAQLWFRDVRLFRGRKAPRATATKLRSFYVNRDVDTGRRAFIEGHLEKFGDTLSPTRVPAVDAYAEGYDALAFVPASVERPIQAPRHMPEQTMSACFLSHATIWQRMLDEDVPIALVVEDDVEITPRVRALAAQLPSLEEADLIFVNDRVVRYRRLVPEAENPEGLLAIDKLHSGAARALEPGTFERSTIVPEGRLKTAPGSDGYVVTKTGAARLLHNLGVFGRFCHVDNFLFASCLSPAEVATLPQVPSKFEVVTRSLAKGGVQLRGWVTDQPVVIDRHKQVGGTVLHAYKKAKAVPVAE